MTDSFLEGAFEELKSRLGWSELDQRIREELATHDNDLITHAYPHGGEEEWYDLKKEARKIARLLANQPGGKTPPGRTPNDDSAEEQSAQQLKDEELDRSWAFSEYVSKIATTDDNVRRFRNRYLSGNTIQPAQALALLTSPAAAIWPSLEFHVSGFPLLDHTHQILEEERDDKGDYALVEAYDPASGTKKSFKDRRPLEAGAWSVPEQPRDALSNSEETREIKNGKLLSFPDDEYGINRVCVRTGSVLGDLRERVHKLIRRYPWWESEAAWFILTGVTPWVAPVSLQTRGNGLTYRFERQFITIKVEPWVSEETVRRTYREAQVRLLQGDNHPAKSKQLDLFRFVSTRTDPYTLYGRERARVAKELVPEWDRENPHNPYRGDTRRFWRDYDRAVRLIALPLEAAEQRARKRKLRERLRKEQ